MNHLQMTGRFKVAKENIEAFKKIVQACIKSTEEKDLHTLQYDWFCNENQTEWTVREIFKDSDAAITHMENLDELMDEILAVSDYFPEIYGNPSEEFLNAISGFVPKVYSFFGQAKELQ